MTKTAGAVATLAVAAISIFSMSQDSQRPPTTPKPAVRVQAITCHTPLHGPGIQLWEATLCSIV